VPEDIPLLEWVNIPVVVPPSARQLVVGEGEVPQQVPLAVIEDPPSEARLAPKVAVVSVIEETVGEVTVGAVATKEGGTAIVKATHCSEADVHVPGSSVCVSKKRSATAVATPLALHLV